MPDEMPPEAVGFDIETRDEIDLGQCEICFCLVAKDVELDHQEWHQRQAKIQTNVDISISELWAGMRKGVSQEAVQHIIEDHVRRITKVIRSS